MTITSITSIPPTSTPTAAPTLAQVQRAPRPDALLESLLAVCRIHGLAATRDSLMAGMPVDDGGMTLATAERAAQRAGLSTRLYKVDLLSIEKAALPAILLLRDRGACVLLGSDDPGPSADAGRTDSAGFEDGPISFDGSEDGDLDGPGASVRARVILPQTGMAEVPMSIADLEARYAGVVLFAHPKLDAGTLVPDAARPGRRGHWFWSAVLAQRSVYRDVLWAAALVNLLAIALPMFTMNVYDRVVPNSAFETLWALSVGVALAIGAESMLRALRSRFVDEASARVDVELSARLMQQVLDLRLEHRPASVGVFASTLRGFESVRELIASGTVTALIDLPFGLLYLALVVWISPWLSLPVIAAFAATVVLGAWLQQRLHRVSQLSWQAAAQRQAALVETIAGLETVKAQGAQGRVQSRWERANEHLAGLTVRMRAQSTSAMLGAAWISQMTTVAIVVIGVHLIAERTLTMGALIAVSMLASRALGPASQIVGLLLQYQGARSSLDALDKLMSAPLERDAFAADDGSTVGAHAARGPLRGAIAFDKVSFQYPGRDDTALHEVSFTIAPGECVAFIGRAGSGKSTIQRLLMGLYQPTSGTVRFDGVDSRQFDPLSLRREIASVGQDNLLFQGTLRDNIALALPHADDADVLAAARAAGLEPFIDKHPRGLQLQVGERGEGLSGGQRQAVALARALLHGGTILCLDEPTGAMDQASEALVAGELAGHQRACVGAAAKGRTLILSTHRRSLLALVTRVIVIDEGRIVADGPRDRVLAAIEAPKVGQATAAAQAGTVIAAAKAATAVTSLPTAPAVAATHTGTVAMPPRVTPPTVLPPKATLPPELPKTTPPVDLPKATPSLEPPRAITAVAAPKADAAAELPRARPVAAPAEEIPVFTLQKARPAVALPPAQPVVTPIETGTALAAAKARKTSTASKKRAPAKRAVAVDAAPADASGTAPQGVSETTPPATTDTMPAGVIEMKRASASDTKPASASDTKPAGMNETKLASPSNANPAGATDTKPAASSDMKHADFADTVPAEFADAAPAAPPDAPAAPAAEAGR